MSYSKKTSVNGYKSTGEQVYHYLNGHWKPEKAADKLRKAGAVGRVTVDHIVIDNSGKGRGSSKLITVD